MTDSDIDRVTEDLRPLLSNELLRTRGAAPFAFDVAGGPHLELRFVENLDALCISAPLGELFRSTQAQAGLGLLLGNLILAEHGKPHYAVDAGSGTAHLCHTVQGWAAAQQDQPPQEAVRSFLECWLRSREALREAAFIG